MQQEQAIDASVLQGRPEWVTFGLFREALLTTTASRLCRHELWPVSQLEGCPIRMTGLAELQPVDTAEHRQEVLAQWRQWRSMHITRNCRPTPSGAPCA